MLLIKYGSIQHNSNGEALCYSHNNRPSFAVDNPSDRLIVLHIQNAASQLANVADPNKEQYIAETNTLYLPPNNNITKPTFLSPFNIQSVHKTQIKCPTCIDNPTIVPLIAKRYFTSTSFQNGPPTPYDKGVIIPTTNIIRTPRLMTPFFNDTSHFLIMSPSKTNNKPTNNILHVIAHIHGHWDILTLSKLDKRDIDPTYSIKIVHPNELLTIINDLKNHIQW